MQSAIQLSTLRARGEQRMNLFSRVSETSFEGVEFDGPPQRGDAVGLSATGLDPVAAHVPASELDADPDAVVEACRRVGCDTVVVPALETRQFHTLNAVERAAEALSQAARRLERDGLRLCYHNNDFEFENLGSLTAFEALHSFTDDRVKFEIDLGGALAGGANPPELLARLRGRVPLVHLTDVDAGTARQVELGEGDLDLQACVDAAEAADVEWLVYERDDPADPIASMHHGASTLADLTAPPGLF